VYLGLLTNLLIKKYTYFIVVEFRMVAHVPVLSRSDQPTFAIVSLLYCEKLAVDAMIDYKATYIRCKKGGRILLTFCRESFRR